MFSLLGMTSALSLTVKVILIFKMPMPKLNPTFNRIIFLSHTILCLDVYDVTVYIVFSSNYGSNVVIFLSPLLEYEPLECNTHFIFLFISDILQYILIKLNLLTDPYDFISIWDAKTKLLLKHV